jgi:hypothetical protein
MIVRSLIDRSSNKALTVFLSAIINRTIASDTGPRTATEWVFISAAMAAAKDSIENNAGDHTQENENDALQRHGVLLLPAYAPGVFALSCGAERRSDLNAELYGRNVQ